MPLNESLLDSRYLQLDEEDMRRLGYRIVDELVEHYRSIEGRPVVSANIEDMCLPEVFKDFPAAGRDPDQVLSRAIETLSANCMHLTHPRFYAYIPGPSNYISTLADFLASGLNIFAGTAAENMGPFEIEHNTIRWLCNVAGLDETAGGLFVSGGSVASLTGLTAARHVMLQDDITGATVYLSTQTHSSVERALFILGFRDEQLRTIAVDDEFRINSDELEETIKRDREAGLRPFCIIGSAGTTNTGAVDPLDTLAAICKRESMWLHIDAAYGGGALLSTSERHRFNGIERADSIALDPHKWLFQPYECGCVLVRDGGWLRKTFRRLPDYMRDSDLEGRSRNFRDMSPQVTRSFKAFKLWLSLQVFGTDAFSAAVEKGLEMARFTEKCLRSSDNWEIISPATLGVVTFRYVADGLAEKDLDVLNGDIIDDINRNGFAYFSSTILNGHKVNRICPLHPALKREDITASIEKMEQIAASHHLLL